LATQVRTFASSGVVSSMGYSKEAHRTEPRSVEPAQKNAQGLEEVCAQSIEFVAVPDMAARLQATLPAAIRSALQKSEGFAGCVVMVSEEEARLVTVVTFWRGKQRSSKANANALWVEQLLDPYIDRQLRVNKLRAQIAWPAGTPTAKSSEFAGELNEAGQHGAE
jgi:hypothetical protein